MHTTLRAVAAMAALALAAPALAQSTQAQPMGPRVGLGVSFNSTLLGIQPADANTTAFVRPKLYVPIVLAPNVRIEPEIGWLKSKNDTDSTLDSAFDLGIGALLLKPVNPVVDLYFGGRLALVWVRSETVVGGGVVQKVTQRNFSIAPVLGAEYKPSPWFSIGVEAQLNLIFLGDEDVSRSDGTGGTGSGGSATSLEGLAFLRAYFL
jgi:hypothetical protein